MSAKPQFPHESVESMRRELTAKDCEIDTLHAIVDRFPAFTPHRLLPSGHLQTIAASLFCGKRFPHRAKLHAVVFENGDTTFLHDDSPKNWQPTSPVALLIHGLGGCGRSSYLTRAAGRLNEAGVRTFRLDYRASGVGEGRSRLPYHPGCSDDVRRAIERIVELCPASPLSLVGYSIGGNIALKLLGESPRQLPSTLQRAVVVSPPIDLNRCVDHLTSLAGRYYDRYLVKLLHKQLMRSDLLLEQAPHVIDAPRPLCQREFDQLYTAPAWGFDSVDDFYAANSSLSLIPNIRVPTLLLAARDDPLVPAELFEQLEPTSSLRVHLTDRGGHLGFVGSGGIDPDRRWMDWRIIDWLTADAHEARRAAAA